jgi:hypothetical protein
VEFLTINGFDIPPGKSKKFQQWVRDNHQALNQAAPEGIELVGIFATMFSSEKNTGQFKTVWRMDSYGAMDRFAAAVQENPELRRLLDEMGAFQDIRLGAGNSNALLKSVADLSIWADYPEE